MAVYNMPPEFAKRLFKGAPFEATHDKKISSFDEILLRLFCGAPLRGNVQRRAVSDVPAVFFFEDSEELECRLY